jgi:tetraacyldisaccharide 4'-kinase
MNRRWLAPLTPLYAAGLALRNRRIESGAEPVRRLDWPVISIGNLSTGGAGKTPLTIALAETLVRHGLHVDVLSRGYGRQSKLPARVDPDGTAAQFGDEPLLIAQDAGVPVYVAPQRFDAGQLAETAADLFWEKTGSGSAEKRCFVSGHDLSRAVNAAKSAGALAPEERFSANFPITRSFPPNEETPPNFTAVHLLDDGFQHRQLHRDVNILLINRHDWQDRLLPAGNLREPLLAARRATVMAIPSDDPDFEAVLRAWGWQGPIWGLHRTMEVPSVNGPVVAFCGIARPKQFFVGLEAAGLRLAARVPFADHRRYTLADLKRLATAARKAGAAALLTTEKDRVRLGKLTSALPESLPLRTARLRLEIENEDEAVSWLMGRLKPAPVPPPL